MKTISYKHIMTLNPCYDPVDIGMPKNYEDTIPNFIREYRNKVRSKRDVFWTLVRSEYMSYKEIAKFALFCARSVQHLLKNQRSIDILDNIEDYLNDRSALKELAYSAYSTANASYDARASAEDDAAVYASDAVDAAYDIVYYAANANTVFISNVAGAAASCAGDAYAASYAAKTSADAVDAYGVREAAAEDAKADAEGTTAAKAYDAADANYYAAYAVYAAEATYGKSIKQDEFINYLLEMDWA